MKPCKAFLRRTFPYGRNIYCPCDATHAVLAVGPEGQQIVHGRHCLQHAKRLAKMFAKKTGWHLEIAKIIADAQFVCLDEFT